MRENTLLPLGDTDATPDYAFERNVTLRLYALTDAAERIVRNRLGQPAFSVRAERNGNQVSMLVEGSAEGLQIQLMGVQAVDALTGAQAVPAPEGLLLTVRAQELRFSLPS